MALFKILTFLKFPTMYMVYGDACVVRMCVRVAYGLCVCMCVCACVRVCVHICNLL